VLTAIFGARFKNDVADPEALNKILKLDKVSNGSLKTSLYSAEEYKNVKEMLDSDLISHKEYVDMFSASDQTYKILVNGYVNNRDMGVIEWEDNDLGSRKWDDDSDKERIQTMNKIRSEALLATIKAKNLEDRYEMFVTDKEEKKKLEKEEQKEKQTN
jgi:hypothetical protein